MSMSRWSRSFPGLRFPPSHLPRNDGPLPVTGRRSKIGRCPVDVRAATSDIDRMYSSSRYRSSIRSSLISKTLPSCLETRFSFSLRSIGFYKCDGFLKSLAGQNCVNRDGWSLFTIGAFDTPNLSGLNQESFLTPPCFFMPEKTGRLEPRHHPSTPPRTLHDYLRYMGTK